ncbi:MAG: hypothetical protein E7404_04545 [Ruminococcaceae bacterium]|nr:hypothetical protein [Oscillospiraceae bacterium]
MFGYVNVFADELKIREYNLYKSYYCGLCKQLGKDFNQFVRLGLSYDFTFLAIVFDGLNDSKPVIEKEGCIKHISKKRPIIKNNDGIEYAANLSVILTYYKLCDDIIDEKIKKSYLLRIPYKSAIKKINSIDKNIFKNIEENLSLLSKLEKEKCNEIDVVSDAFAKIMQSIFSFDERLLNFGYNLGKFIYVIDALDDIDKDYKNKSYNPFLLKYGYDNKEKILENAQFLLMYTLSKLAEEFENIKFYKNYEIIKNIIYLGLRQKTDFVLQRRRNCNEKSI